MNFIHEAKDTGKLISTEPVIFGYYKQDDGKFEAILAGKNLTHELWLKAKESFEKSGGKCKDEIEPDTLFINKEERSPDFSKVIFVRKITVKNPPNPTYEDYKCDDTELAKEFLMSKTVDKKLYYIAVTTPKEIWGMDIDGIYKAKLQSWQNDTSSVVVEGSTEGMPAITSLHGAAKGYNDNFVIKVKCGNCGHSWLDGLRYNNWTVVECPKCLKRNKINSDNFLSF